MICAALARGRQALILRKGGIAEAEGTFRVEHTRFWLYPTYVHQQETGIVGELADLLKEVRAQRPPSGVVRLSHFVEVAGVYLAHDLTGALSLAGMHGWSEETVRQRFAYRTPGLFVLPVRVYRVPEVIEVPELPRYAGCKSWVDLEGALPTEGAEPVLEELKFRQVVHTLEERLKPSALV